MFISSFPPNYNIDKIKTVFIRSRAPDLHSLFYTLRKTWFYFFAIIKTSSLSLKEFCCI